MARTTEIFKKGCVIGDLTILQETVSESTERAWLCECSCGDIVVRKYSTLRCCKSEDRGRCDRCNKEFVAEAERKYPKGHRELYGIWKSMNSRCHDPSNLNYKNYGGRGITVCPDWRDTDTENFLNFIKDLKARPSKKHSLDRIDNSKGYSKDNVRWATQKEQTRNTRRNSLLTYDGTTMCVQAWAEHLGVKENTLTYRKIRGWSDEEVILGKRYDLPEKDLEFSMKSRVGDEMFYLGLDLAINTNVPKARIADMWGCDASQVSRIANNEKVVSWFLANDFQNAVTVVTPLEVFLERKTVDDRKYLLNLNQYRNWQGHENNAVKKKFKEVMEDQLLGLKIEGKFKVYFKLYKRSARRTDKSNFYSVISKFLYDAMSELGCIEDDNDSIVQEEILKITEVDKESPRAEFTFVPILNEQEEGKLG